MSKDARISEMEVALVALVENLKTALDLHLPLEIGAWGFFAAFWMGDFFLGHENTP